MKPGERAIEQMQKEFYKHCQGENDPILSSNPSIAAAQAYADAIRIIKEEFSKEQADETQGD